MSARQPIEDIEASLLAATKSALGPSQSHMGRVICAVQLTLTTDGSAGVGAAGRRGTSQLRSKFDLAGESAAGAKRPYDTSTRPESPPGPLSLFRNQVIGLDRCISVDRQKVISTMTKSIVE